MIAVPLKIKHIICLTTKKNSSITLRYEQLGLREFKKISLHQGGTHFCICNINSKGYQVLIEANNVIFDIIQVKRKDTLVLVEKTWIPINTKTHIPSLWNLCAIELLKQGITSCNLILKAPLFQLKTVFVFITTHFNRYGFCQTKDSPTCKLTKAFINCHNLEFLAGNFLEQ